MFLQVAAVVSLCSAKQSESYAPLPFSHYESILERMPFGELPDKFGESIDPNAAKQEALLKAEQEKLARKINMSAVNITPQGDTAIGFTDLSSKPPVSYYLLVGTESGGWKVNSANYEEETAEIEKDGVIISLQLGKGLVSKSPAPAPSKASRSKTVRTVFKKSGTQAPSTHSSRSTGSSASIRRTTTPSSTSIRDQLRNIQSKHDRSSDARSYMARLRERKIEQSKALELAKTTQRKQLEKLAREVASKEIKKQAVAIAEVALEKELALEEQRLLQKLEKEEKEQSTF